VQALRDEVVDAVWQSVAALLPTRPAAAHPLGCHRPPIADRRCFEGILWRLVTGCSWVTAGRIVGVGATTLRRRRDAWIAAGVFEALFAQALAAYDRIIGLDLSEASVDGSLHKAPFGGEGTGRNPTDRGKLGWKWSLAADRWGIPIGWAIAGANRNDLVLLAPTLDDIDARAGLLADIDTLHLDRGYDADTVRAACAERDLHDVVISKRRKPSKGKNTTTGSGDKRPPGLGLRWAVERSNSWFSNFGQLRRNTDRRTIHRHAQIALAVTLILTVKLINWADHYKLRPPP
jgi:transposase